MKDHDHIERRLASLPRLSEEVSVAASGGDQSINPVVAVVIELAVVAGVFTGPSGETDDSDPPEDIRH